MKRILASVFVLAACGSSLLAACSSSDDSSSSTGGSGGASAHGGSGGDSSQAGSAGKGGSSGHAGSGGTADGANEAGQGGSSEIGVGGAGEAGEGSSEAGSAGADTAAAGAASCDDARKQLIGSVSTVASGAVTALDTTNGVTTLYVDGSAGGIASASASAWLFVDLSQAAKAPLDDVSSLTSTAWDLAFKRPVIYTNDGDGGPGTGGAALIAKDFDAVTASDATGVNLGTESFLDASCTPNLDLAGSVETTFSSWYDYNPTTHVLTPAAGTWLVKGGTGKLYKLAFQTYYSTADGQVGTGDGGTYLLKFGAL